MTGYYPEIAREQSPLVPCSQVRTTISTQRQAFQSTSTAWLNPAPTGGYPLVAPALEAIMANGCFSDRLLPME
ncbi:MAG TPA: hypothetical protein VKZ53_20870 [Candidatus Angelobacter sp.]|nr:hypothetical protein [Candidatus Angelobacter sp.]